VSAKRHWADSSPEEKSSFDDMMATGEEADVEITQSLSSAEVAVDSYLQEPVQPMSIGNRKRVCIKFWQRWQLNIYLFLLLQLLLNVCSVQPEILSVTNVIV